MQKQMIKSLRKCGTKNVTLMLDYIRNLDLIHSKQSKVVYMDNEVVEDKRNRWLDWWDTTTL